MMLKGTMTASLVKVVTSLMSDPQILTPLTLRATPIMMHVLHVQLVLRQGSRPLMDQRRVKSVRTPHQPLTAAMQYAPLYG